jgi:hypothetical protein
MRKLICCRNCGEEREMAAHGLCWKCYRREERANDRPRVDRHSPGVRREHKKAFRGFTNLMLGLSDLGVSKNDVLAIRRMVEPYLEPIATFLALDPEKSEGRVNGEQESQLGFTVHGAVNQQ